MWLIDKAGIAAEIRALATMCETEDAVEFVNGIIKSDSEPPEAKVKNLKEMFEFLEAPATEDAREKEKPNGL
jgi:hypothetical protein